MICNVECYDNYNNNLDAIIDAYSFDGNDGNDMTHFGLIIIYSLCWSECFGILSN